MRILSIILSILLATSNCFAAQQTFDGGVLYPDMTSSNNRGGVFLSDVIDAADEERATVFQVPKTGTISKVGWRTNTVTTGATVDVRLETVSATDGFPTGTLLDTDTNGSQVIGDGDDDTWVTTTLTAGAAVTKGDIIALTIVNPSTSFGDMQISTKDTSAWGTSNFPYGVNYIGAPAWAVSTELSVLALEYDDGSYATIPLIKPFSAQSDITYSNASDPDEIGIKFKMGVPTRITGVYLWIDADNVVDIVLYDSDGSTVLETISIDPDIRGNPYYGRHVFLFTSTYSLTKDTYYRITVKPTSAGNVKIPDFTVDSAAVMDAIKGGQDFHKTERTDGGAWTDTTTKRAFIGLIINGFDDGVQVGGGTNANGAIGVAF